MAESSVRKGYLVIADISGYTAFLTGNELEHANAIVDELTAEIVAALRPSFRIVKLEGDAVLCYALEESFGSPERILEAIEHCYCRFSDHQLDMERQTTCTCSACAAISTLDLKLLAHFGEFVLRRSGEQPDIAGPDVILLHRLLKNGVQDAFGLRAYALLTSAVAQRFDPPLVLPVHHEEVEGFGGVEARVEALQPVAAARREARRVYVSDEDADLRAELRLPVTLAEAWEWNVNPARALQWLPGVTGWEDHPDAEGRVRSGATAHCAHGKGRSFMRYVDWRPFEYITTDKVPARKSFGTPPRMVDTTEFIAGDGETRVIYRCRMYDRKPLDRLRVRLMRPIIVRQFAAAERKLRALLSDDHPR